MSNAEYVRSILMNYPAIRDSQDAVHIDFLGMTPTQYSIRGMETQGVVKTYLNGDTLRRFGFMLESARSTLQDAQRASNQALYENLAQWLETQTRQRTLPAMDNGLRAMGIAATGTAYLVEAEDAQSQETGIYRMQMELTYYQKARN